MATLIYEGFIWSFTLYLTGNKQEQFFFDVMVHGCALVDVFTVYSTEVVYN